jgi:16S rRNA (guanine966-N2)-methyltransferase
MRIIAGEFRGRTLAEPDFDQTRPITDRAKQSLFDALQNRFADGVVLDCFSGSGSLGLECLSRGATRVIFVERDRAALKALRANIDALGVRERSVVLPIDAYATQRHPDVHELALAFVDPPYSHVETGHLRHKVDELLRALAAGALTADGLISFRHPTRTSVDAGALGVRVVRELSYGDMAITWLARAVAP